MGEQRRGRRERRDPGRGLGGALGYAGLFFMRFGYSTRSDKCDAFITVQQKTRRNLSLPHWVELGGPLAKRQRPTCRDQGTGR